jgi:transposase-like protein
MLQTVTTLDVCDSVLKFLPIARLAGPHAGRKGQMSGHGEKLSHKQERAIAALLVAPSVTAAAQQIGVNENTLLRWLKDAAFQSAYRDARRAVVQHAIAQVQRATGEAVETLRTVMQDSESPASARVSAAKAILDTALKGIDIDDLEVRIAALEALGTPP